MALKDPRLSLTLPFWNQLMEVDGVVVALRSPKEVAASLTRRNGIGEERSAALWLQYTTSAYALAYPRLVMRYQAIIDHVDPAIFALGEHLGLAVGSIQLERCRQFLQPSLRHHIADGSSPTAGPVMALASEIYLDLYHDAPAGRPRTDITQVLSVITSRLDESTDAANELSIQLEAATARAEESKIEREEFARRAAAADRRYEALREAESVKAALWIAERMQVMSRLVRIRSWIAARWGPRPQRTLAERAHRPWAPTRKDRQ